MGTTTRVMTSCHTSLKRVWSVLRRRTIEASNDNNSTFAETAGDGFIVEKNTKFLSADHSLVVSHIRHQRWEPFILALNGTNFQELNECFCATTEYDDHSILSFALRHNPPFSVIRKIIQARPQCIHEKGSCGQTPLHVAVSSRASKYIVGFLASTYPKACEERDHDGKTPLHLIFAHKLDSVSTELAEILVQTSPSSLDVEDNDEMCVLELAILREAPLKIVLLMQRVKRRHLSKTKQRAPNSTNGIMNGTSTENGTRIHSLSSVAA